MRSHPFLAVLASAVVGAGTLAGCSSGAVSGGASKTASVAPSSTEASSLVPHTAAPGVVGQSDGGVTTAVGTPAESTEDEYFAACQAAKTWMAGKGGDPKSQFEPYLAELQGTDVAGPGTFETPWSRLPPARQAAVIVAAEAAANELCG